MIKEIALSFALILGATPVFAQSSTPQNPMVGYNAQQGPQPPFPGWAYGNTQDHRLPISPSGAAPTITAGCSGAGSAVGAGTTDTAGTITGSTSAATTCTITFANAYTTAPICVSTGKQSAILTQTISTTTLVTTFASTANYIFTYICFGL